MNKYIWGEKYQENKSVDRESLIFSWKPTQNSMGESDLISPSNKQGFICFLWSIYMPLS